MNTSTSYIWDEFSDRLLRFIQSRVDSRADAEDILMNVFISIHQGLSKLKNESRLTSWVYRITRNAIYDYYKKNNTVRVNIEDIQWAEADDTNESTIPEEVLGCVAIMLNQLPDTYKEALTLSELKNTKQADVAQILGISLSGAKSRIQRGRKMLKASLEACCNIKRDGQKLDISSEMACEGKC